MNGPTDAELIAQELGAEVHEMTNLEEDLELLSALGIDPLDLEDEGYDEESNIAINGM